MSQINFKGSPINLAGTFPKVGDILSDFVLSTNELKDVKLTDFKGKQIVLSIFPSLDTPVCADSVRRFNTEAAKYKNAIILCISKDLPFAQTRFCGVENIKEAMTLSAFRNPEFGQQLGVAITDGAVRGLLARAVIVLNPEGKVTYTELVPEVTHEPNYDRCLAALTI